MNKIIVSPSILAADFANFGAAISTIEASGASWIHMDVMDGSFVPNITFGSPLIRALRSKTLIFFDVHLMIVNPLLHVKEFIQAGANSITFHYEAHDDPVSLLKKIKTLDCNAGISIKPETPVSVLEKILPYLDLALIMTVNPGYGGQELIPHCLEKVKTLAKMRKEAGLSFRISVDGGINEQTVAKAMEAGADTLVMGSAFFGSTDKKELIRKILAQGSL